MNAVLKTILGPTAALLLSRKTQAVVASTIAGWLVARWGWESGLSDIVVGWIASTIVAVGGVIAYCIAKEDAAEKSAGNVLTGTLQTMETKESPPPGSPLPVLALLCVLPLMLAGCNQDTRNPQDMRAGQYAGSATNQDAATQGSQVYTYIINAPGRGSPYGVGASGVDMAGLLAGTDGGGEAVGDLASTGAGNGVTGPKAGYLQGGITLNITTGGTAPSLTGTTTGSATQTPTQTSTQYPHQEVRPETALSANAGLAPGGIVDQNATAANRGNADGSGKTSTNTLTVSQIKAAMDQLSKLSSEQLDALLPFLPPGMRDLLVVGPATQPASEPSE